MIIFLIKLQISLFLQPSDPSNVGFGLISMNGNDDLTDFNKKLKRKETGTNVTSHCILMKDLNVHDINLH